jgi:hypothetical protein
MGHCRLDSISGAFSVPGIDFITPYVSRPAIPPLLSIRRFGQVFVRSWLTG